MIFITELPPAPAEISPLDGPSLPVKMCRGLAAHVNVQFGMWTNGVYGVEFDYKSPLTVEELAQRYRREFPDSIHSSYSSNSYHFSRYRDSVYQDVWITKNFGPIDPKLTSIQISEVANPTQPPPRRWFREAISINPPAPLVRVPFDPSFSAQTVFPLLRPATETKSGRPHQEGFIFNAYLPKPLKSVFLKATEWLFAHGYRPIRAHEWFKPNVPLFEVGITDESFQGPSKGTRVTMYCSNTDNRQPMPYSPPHAGSSRTK